MSMEAVYARVHSLIKAGITRRAAEAMEATRSMPFTGVKGSGGRLRSTKPPLTAAAVKQIQERAKEFQARRLAGDITVQRLDNGIDAETKRRILERKKLTKELTDDTVNSEAKLHALYLKWLAINVDYHFDVEDEKAFKDRFGKFMDNARYINMRNKRASSTVCGLNPYSDLSASEFGSSRYESYPKKANQVIAGLAEYMDKKAN